MSSSTIIALALSFLAIGGTSASPLTQRQNGVCQPNFQGVGVSVTDSASEKFEWSLASPAVAGNPVVTGPFTIGQAEFRFEFTGAPTNTYLIKYVFNSSIVCPLANFISFFQGHSLTLSSFFLLRGVRRASSSSLFPIQQTRESLPVHTKSPRTKFIHAAVKHSTSLANLAVLHLRPTLMANSSSIASFPLMPIVVFA
jgi:hypothetical protein